ncbi:hypothetical protein KNE206_77770 [Kitasatospora sp. NE20-6]|uniref:CPBP family intramembrane glutamic endopeptidase n=1 Tax=Kitasatospora sp. NE20-6 TaxID=2859066 RepID=UPI0034DBF73B
MGLFGLSHLLGPHTGLWGAIVIAIETGDVLGAAYAATRRLWAPIGLHSSWNFAASGIFGTEASGTNIRQEHRTPRLRARGRRPTVTPTRKEVCSRYCQAWC